jgi:hypothetical protein
VTGTPHAAPAPAQVEAWLAELGIAPGPRVERDGVAAWDVVLDGRRRRDLRTTLILDPGLGLIAWAHLAPPLGDGLRKAYRALLRWNDEFPLAKFSIADDGRPILAVELPARWLDADSWALPSPGWPAPTGCSRDRAWLWIGGRLPVAYGEGPGRTTDSSTALARGSGAVRGWVSPRPRRRRAWPGSLRRRARRERDRDQAGRRAARGRAAAPA